MGSGSRAVGVKGRGTIIFLAVVPCVLSYAVFLIFPMLYALAMSFSNWNPASLTAELNFTGLQNYQRILFENPLFWVSLRNTIYFALLDVPANLIVALALAVLINSLKRFPDLFRTLYFLPVLTSAVAAAIIWQWILQPRFGLVNSTLAMVFESLGLRVQLPNYLNNSTFAMPSLVAMGVWKGYGYTMIIFLAALQGIPQSLYEAARVDGADGPRCFIHLTLPLLAPAVLFVVLTGIIGTLQVFVPMYLLTKGGPVDATRTVVYILFDEAFVKSRFGYASALSFVLFILIMAVTLLQRRLLQSQWSF
jgi:multiple sugar transport system permease protein